MDDVRAFFSPKPHQAVFGRQAKAQFTVIGQGRATRQDLFHIVPNQAAFACLAGPHHLHQVAACNQALHDAPQRHRNPIDFRGKSFGHNGDAKARRAALKRFNQDVIVHGWHKHIKIR
jgi:hypothetical protein